MQNDAGGFFAPCRMTVVGHCGLDPQSTRAPDEIKVFSLGESKSSSFEKTSIEAFWSGTVFPANTLK